MFSIPLKQLTLFLSTCLILALPVYAQGTSNDSLLQKDRIEIFKSEASLIRLDEPAQLIAVGDTEVADATLVSSQTILLTAKNIGRTNFLAVNGEDQIVKEFIIIVKEPGVSTIQVRRGSEVLEYICRQSQGCSGHLYKLLTLLRAGINPPGIAAWRTAYGADGFL